MKKLEGACVIPVFLIWSSSSLAQTDPCPAQPPNIPVPNISSPRVPADVCVPAGFAGNPIRYFDDYSWRALVAMVWPTIEGQRGTADSSKRAGDVSTPLVFETFKQDWELFQPNGRAPSSNWNDF